MTQVQPGSAAAAAGLRVGDAITAINGKPVQRQQELSNIEGLLPVGEPVTLTVQRDGKLTQLRTRLAARRTELDGGRVDNRLTGARLGAVPERLRRQGVAGVLVNAVAAGSRAELSGLRAGDLITAVNRREVADLDAFERFLGPRPAQLLVTLVRGNSAYLAVME